MPPNVPFDRFVCSEATRQRNPVTARGDREHTCSHAFGELHREVSDTSVGTEDHQREIPARTSIHLQAVITRLYRNIPYTQVPSR